MKKYTIIILSGLWMLVLTSSCRKDLSLAPVSSITSGNFFVNSSQYDAFMAGIMADFRGGTANYQALGELRADIFGTDAGSGSSFTGEATQGLENYWNETLSANVYPGVSTFGGFYTTIGQINLMISELNSPAANVVTQANKNYYLGGCYGMRAFLYYQMYRTWGNCIIQTLPTTGATLNIATLAKAASPQTAVMALIKSDIALSLASFGSDYTFRNVKSYWSQSATLILKADVFLWTSVHNNGGTADAATAQAALTTIQTNVPSLALLPSYANIFPYTASGNNEIIFSVHNALNEATNSWIQTSFVPQSGLIANFYDSAQNRQFNVTTDNWGGLLRAPVKITTFREFNPLDSRALASIQPAYNVTGPFSSTGTNNFTIAGCFTCKYAGQQSAGVRVMTNDWIIYRYADLLLLMAEAKVDQGISPVTEINEIRARAYGANYNAATMGYPNQPIDANPREAILQERLYEFVFEGKRWYDLRRMGDSYVYEHTALLPANSYALLWPIDQTSLTNNRLLVQNPGY